MSEPARAPVSVVIPTAGRLERLRHCLESLAGCEPLPEEVVVVDQSAGAAVAELVSAFRILRARAVPDDGSGIGRALNSGLPAAAQDWVCVTHDDCTVDRSWVGAAVRSLGSSRQTIITGAVHPVGDAKAVPSTITRAEPQEYFGRPRYDVLYPNNMAFDRREVTAIGGFDERIRPAAEDNDLCYRWLSSGGRLRYEPDLVVRHHDWRTHTELERLFVGYAIGQGIFYAKHLRRGDLRMVHAIARDLYAGLRGVAANIVLGTPRWSDSRQGILRGLPVGLVQGWRLYAPSEQGERTDA